MNEPVNVKLFKNGGSWALRIPSSMLPAEKEATLCQRQDGVIELTFKSKKQRMQELLDYLQTQDPLSDSESYFPSGDQMGERWDSEDVFPSGNA